MWEFDLADVYCPSNEGCVAGIGSFGHTNWWEVGLKNRWEDRLVGGELSKIMVGWRMAPQTGRRLVPKQVGDDGMLRPLSQTHTPSDSVI